MIIEYVVRDKEYIDSKVNEALELVGLLIKGGNASFRWGFYVYIVVGMGLAILSMVFKFSGKSEMEEANSNTFEKLD